MSDKTKRAFYRTAAIASVLAIAVSLSIWAGSATAATETTPRFHDRGILRVVTGEADVDVSAADYTTAGGVNLLTIAPADGHVMHDVRVIFDLDKTTTGAAEVLTDGVTCIFSVARKVDGTNFRSAMAGDIASLTTAVTSTDMDNRSLELNLGTVTPTEDARIQIQVGNETDGDFEFPYLLTYRSSAGATITEVAN